MTRAARALLWMLERWGPGRVLLLIVAFAILVAFLTACTIFHHPETGQTLTCQWQAEWGIGFAAWQIPLLPLPSRGADARYRRCKESAVQAGYEAE